MSQESDEWRPNLVATKSSFDGIGFERQASQTAQDRLLGRPDEPVFDR